MNRSGVHLCQCGCGAELVILPRHRFMNIAKGTGAPYRMSAFLVAVPAPNGRWSVVAASYGAL